ncbi:MAG: hypothetical protein HXX18_14310 [Bacteroidetes bacterium]|nr:hypothetical protein [Bacteroidota bacterium]
MKIKLVLISFVLIIAAISLSSCKHDSIPPIIDESAIKDTVYFNDVVLPIIQSNCAYSGCHAGEQNPELSNYSSIKKMVNPGDPKNSRLYTYAIGNKMPPSPKTLLNLDQVTSIYGWILQGALENTEPCDAFQYAFKKDILPLIQRNCISCHNKGSTNGTGPNKGELTDYSQISAKANTILDRISGKNGSIMPPSPQKPLSDCKITKFSNWVNDTIKDN